MIYNITRIQFPDINQTTVESNAILTKPQASGSLKKNQKTDLNRKEHKDFGETSHYSLSRFLHGNTFYFFN